MKKLANTLLIVSLFAVSAVYPYTRWLTTKVAMRTGHCQLESNKIKVIIHRCHIDVEEEAVIAARGNVTAGDPNTLEIKGEFQLSSAASMRSLLLWNGDKLLKAKLIDREHADSIMDSIVDYTYRDPALIRYEGNNRYSFRIYPVSIGNSRKVRVLYSVPLQTVRGRLQFEFQPAFTLGSQYVPTQIPVKFAKADPASQLEYILQHGQTKKALQFGSIYLVPFKDFHQGDSYYYYTSQPQPVIITPDTTGAMHKAYTYKLETTKAAGYYTAIFTTIPDKLIKKINDAQLTNYVLESKIVTSDNSYITDIPKNSAFNIYIKSKTAWDGLINWTVYDENGNAAIQYAQGFDSNSDPSKNAILPLLWGAKYSLVEGLGSLGGIFGFVDNKMSLLALEKDELPADIAQLYIEEGVPTLLPEEIFPDTANIDVPKENIIIDMSDIISMPKDKLDCVLITIMPDNRIIIQLENMNFGNITVEIYNISGRLIKQYKNVKVHNRQARIDLPETMKGIYVMRVKSMAYNVSKKLILK